MRGYGAFPAMTTNPKKTKPDGKTPSGPKQIKTLMRVRYFFAASNSSTCSSSASSFFSVFFNFKVVMITYTMRIAKMSA